MSTESSSGHEKMRAVLIERFGEPSELREREVSRPDPRESEVLVEVRAAAVNHLPRVPGRDFAGIVVEGRTRDRSD